MKFPRAKPRGGFKRDLRAFSDLREGFKRHLKPFPELREGFKCDLMPLSSQGEALLTEFCFAKLAEISFFCTKFVFSELCERFKRDLKALPKLRGQFKCDLKAFSDPRGHFKCDLRALSSQRDALLNEVLVASQGLHTKLVEIGFLCSKFVISMSERGVLGCNPKPCWEKVRAWERKNPASEVEGFPSPK